MFLMSNSIAKIVATSVITLSGWLTLSQQPSFAKSSQIINNVSLSSIDPNNRNVVLTGHHKVYNKAASLKGAKQLTSSSQLKKLADSVRSKDTFRVYRMAATRDHRVYYKIVSFEGKYRGWIYGGKAKGDYAGGLERVNTTAEVTLSDQIRQTTYHLKSSGTSSDENIWNDIPWTQYKASLKTRERKISCVNA